MMGDGVVDIPQIRGWVEDAGFAGYSEVEIFSTGNWWQRDRGEVLDTCIQRHRSAVDGAGDSAGRSADPGRCNRPRRWRVAVAVPNSISPESWPPSSMITLP